LVNQKYFSFDHDFLLYRKIRKIIFKIHFISKQPELKF